MNVTVLHYDVFTETPGHGNPAGVVLQADHLTHQQMQSIAHVAGFTETTFVQRSSNATWRMRYFAPGKEMNLCGHGTIAALTALEQAAQIPQTFTVDTQAGILEGKQAALKTRFRLQQGNPRIVPFQGAVRPILATIGLDIKHLDDRLPIVYGSTGNWTLILPIRRLMDFKMMRPDNEQFQQVLTAVPTASVHPICLETYQSVHLHGRHFSASGAGTVEDPVTGTASGVMGVYHRLFIDPLSTETIRVEQGHEMNRPGTVDILVSGTDSDPSQWQVEMEGGSIFVGARFITI